MNRTLASLLTLALLSLGCATSEGTPPPSQAAPGAATPAAEPAYPQLWSADCKTWAGLTLPLPELGGELEDSDCAPGAPPSGADGNAVNVGHAGVKDAAALHGRYITMAEAAGWRPLDPPAKIPTFTNATYPGFVLKLDSHFAREEGWYTGVFSVKAQR